MEVEGVWLGMDLGSGDRRTLSVQDNQELPAVRTLVREVAISFPVLSSVDSA